MKPAKKRTQKSSKSTTATAKKSKGFTGEERVAMRDVERRAHKRDGAPRGGEHGGEQH